LNKFKITRNNVVMNLKSIKVFWKHCFENIYELSEPFSKPHYEKLVFGVDFCNIERIV